MKDKAACAAALAFATSIPLPVVLGKNMPFSSTDLDGNNDFNSISDH